MRAPPSSRLLSTVLEPLGQARSTTAFPIVSIILAGVLSGCGALQDVKSSSEAPLTAMQVPIAGPLRRSKNPNYFEDARGNALILCGSHSWNTLQDWGTNGAVRTLDFDAFVNFLKAHGHNMTLLWHRATEVPWAAYDREISTGFHGKSLSLDENRTRTSDRWRLEV